MTQLTLPLPSSVRWATTTTECSPFPRLVPALYLWESLTHCSLPSHFLQRADNIYFRMFRKDAEEAAMAIKDDNDDASLLVLDGPGEEPDAVAGLEIDEDMELDAYSEA